MSSTSSSSFRKRVYCCVYGCLNNNGTNPELSYFQIPKDPEKRIKWLGLIAREDLLTVSTINRVCETHFNENDMNMNACRKTLIKNSVPCLNLPSRPTGDKEVQTDLPVNRTSSISSQTDLTASPKMNVTQATASVSADTPRKRKLKSELNSFKRLKSNNAEDAEQTSMKSQREMYIKLCDRFLSKDLAVIAKAQTLLESDQKGSKHSLEYKMFCLNLFHVSPQAYRLLQQTIQLPTKVTLRKLNIPISTQINENLMAALKIKVNNMSDAEKHCTVVVGAMNLKTNLFYDIKNDKIIGFHEVDGLQSPSPAKYALVVLVRGIFVKWSQPIGFALISERKSDENIAKWINKVLLSLFETGLNIRAFVSDLGSDLFNAAKKRGISTDKTHFTINEHKIFYIFDAPHLIKLLRNNFLNYDFHFGDEAVAKFEHVMKFYDFDKKKTFKQAYKLTNRHIDPTNFEKLNVRYATQLLSRSVAVGLSGCMDCKVVDESAKHTVEFIKSMNDLFDVLNASVVRHSYKYKRAFHGDASQKDFVDKMVQFFQTLKLVNPKTKQDGTEGVEFIEGFQITITSILSLFKDLKQEGFQYLLTRRLNQDVMENFFRKIRSKSGKTTEPTSRQFISASRKIYFANLCQPSKESNRTKDLTKFLVHLEDFATRLNDNRNVTNPSSGIEEQGNNLREIVRSDYTQFDIPEKNAFPYICGALLRKCIDHHTNCEIFKTYINIKLEASNSDDRNYGTDRNLLDVPPGEFVENVKRLEQVFLTAFQQRYLNSMIGNHIYEEMDKVDFTLPCLCFPKEYLLKLYTRMRIYSTLKSNNQAFRTSRDRRNFSVTNL